MIRRFGSSALSRRDVSRISRVSTPVANNSAMREFHSVFSIAASLVMCSGCVLCFGSWANNICNVSKYGRWRFRNSIDDVIMVSDFKTARYIGGFFGFLFYWFIVGPKKYSSLGKALKSECIDMNNQSSQLTERDSQRASIYRRLNEIRMQPVKSLPMNAFMMWMVGNEVSIFSIMFVGMAVVNPLQSIAATGSIFQDFNDDAKDDSAIRSALSQSKLIYIGCCLVAFAVALVKLSWMGLLPVNAMDWLDTIPPTYKEASYGSFFV